MESLLQIFNEHGRKLATAASIALIVLMSLSVANTVLFVMEQRAGSTTEISLDTPAQGTGKPAKTYRVSDLELFGSLSETPAEQVVDAPETKLNLELQGVFISEDENLSTAIIGERAKAGELYAIGDRLPGNATLAAVLVDHVLIRRGSRMEKLMFSDSKFRMAQDTSTNRDAVGTFTGTGADARRSRLENIRNRIRGSGEPAIDLPTADNAGQAAGNAIASYRDRLKNDPTGALQEIGVSPVSGTGADGYRVGGDAPDVVRRAGIQPGDVILSVNGRPVGMAANDSALIDQVMASSRVRVEVQRGSRRFFLTVPVPK